MKSKDKSYKCLIASFLILKMSWIDRLRISKIKSNRKNLTKNEELKDIAKIDFHKNISQTSDY